MGIQVLASDVETIVNVIVGIVTCIGILSAGIWTFYVYVLGRSWAPNIRLCANLKHVRNVGNMRTATVTVGMRNNGGTQAKDVKCWVSLLPITISKSQQLSDLERIDLPVEENVATANVYNVFAGNTGLEPGEEVSEDVVLALTTSEAFKIGITVFIRNGKLKWVTSTVIAANNGSAVVDLLSRGEGSEQ